MLSWFTGRGANTRKSKELYGAVVAAARAPEFYREYGVPDTLNGRYEMIVLALFQLLERLRAEGSAAAEMSRLTLEAFFTDMDDCMREIGIGDVAVPKKVKKAAAGFYERAKAYRAALEADDASALAAALETFIASDSIAPNNGERTGEAAHAAVHGTATDVAATSLAGDTEKRASARFAKLAAHAIRQRDVLARADIVTVLAGNAFAVPLAA